MIKQETGNKKFWSAKLIKNNIDIVDPVYNTSHYFLVFIESNMLITNLEYSIMNFLLLKYNFDHYILYYHIIIFNKLFLFLFLNSWIIKENIYDC